MAYLSRKRIGLKGQGLYRCFQMYPGPRPHRDLYWRFPYLMPMQVEAELAELYTSLYVAKQIENGDLVSRLLSHDDRVQVLKQYFADFVTYQAPDMKTPYLIDGWYFSLKGVYDWLRSIDPKYFPKGFNGWPIFEPTQEMLYELQGLGWL